MFDALVSFYSSYSEILLTSFGAILGWAVAHIYSTNTDKRLSKAFRLLAMQVFLQSNHEFSNIQFPLIDSSLNLVKVTSSNVSLTRKLRRYLRKNDFDSVFFALEESKGEALDQLQQISNVYASLLVRTGNVSMALQYYLQSLKMLPNSLKVMNNLLAAHIISFNYAEMALVKNQLEALIEKSESDVNQRIIGYCQIADVYKLQGNVNKCRDNIQLAKSLITKETDNYALIFYYNSASEYYYFITDFSNASTLLGKALKHCHGDELKYSTVYPNLLRNRSALLAISSRKKDALRLARKALKLICTIYSENHIEVSRAYDTLGWVYCQMDLFEDSEKSYLKAYQIALLTKISYNVVFSFSNLLNCYLNFQRLDKASELMRQINNDYFYEPSINSYAYGICLMNIGIFHYLCGDKAEANNYLHKSLKHIKQSDIRNNYYLGILLQNLGVLHLDKTEYDVAENFFTESLNYFNQESVKKITNLGHNGLVMSYNINPH